jgi:hypothetical protein
MFRNHHPRLLLAVGAVLAIAAPIGIAGAQVGTLATSTTLLGDNSEWDVDLEGEGCVDEFDAQDGFNVNDAKLLDPSLLDAYDDAFLIYVDDVIYNPASFDTDDASFADGDPVTIGGLEVVSKYQTFPEANDILRHLSSFTNPGGSDLSVVVSWASNLGSDSGTVIEGTSSGNDVFEPGDSWVVTSDGGPGDPVVSFGFFGQANPGSDWAPLQPFQLNPSTDCVDNSINEGSDEVSVDYALTVPAGTTCSLLVFGGLNETIEGALDGAPGLTTPGAGLLDGLSDEELASVVNYNLAASNPCLSPASVPDTPDAPDAPAEPVPLAPSFTG